MGSPVIYWPRHLYTSTAASLSTVFCRQLSNNAFCVVSLESDASTGLELLPVTTSRSHCVVLFDAQVASLGGFETLHLPQVLQEMGQQFARQSTTHDEAARTVGGTLGWLLETTGYFLVYGPFAMLLTVTSAIQRLVHDTKTPSWLPIGGHKSLAVTKMWCHTLQRGK